MEERMAFQEPALPPSQRRGCQPGTSLQQLGEGGGNNAPQTQGPKGHCQALRFKPALSALSVLIPCDLGGAVMSYLSPFFYR